MKIETQPLENHVVKLLVELDEETMENFKHRAARKISQEAKIPGFRPGKAPYDVVRRLYGDEGIDKQAITMLVDDIYPKALDESGVKPAAPGSLDEIISTHPPKFSFTIPLEPIVELGNYLAIRKEYNLEPLTEDEVNQVLKNMQRNYATAEPVSRPVQKTDLVYMKLAAQVTVTTEDEEKEIIKERPYQVVVGEDEEQPNPWPFNGFSKELIGLSADEGKTIIYQYPDDSPFEKLRGKEVEFQITIQSVKELKLPDLNEDFAKSVGSYQTLDELTVAIRNNLESDHKNDYEQKYFSEIMDEIISISTVKYPAVALEDEIQKMLKSLVEDLKERNTELETYLKSRKLSKEAFIENEIKPAAILRLERALVLHEVGQKEKVEVSEETLKSEVIQTMSQIFNTSGFQAPKSSHQRKQLMNAVSYDTANRLINQYIMDRLKLIATGQANKEETDLNAKETETQTNEQPVESTPAPVKKRASVKKKKVEEA